MSVSWIQIVMARTSSRFVAWLCLAVLLLTGVAPARGFVVCIEVDGCVSLEVKAQDADCGSCEEHEREAPAGEEVAEPNANSECPCIDYVVPGVPDQRVSSNRSLELPVGPMVAAPTSDFHVAPVPIATMERGPPPRVPRVAPALAHIRTVILLV